MIRKTTFLKLHRWTGLTVGLLLVVQALTGTALVFRDELERLVDPGLVVAGGPARVPVQSVIDAVRAAHPGAAVLRVELPRADDQALMVRSEGGGQRRLTAVDPFSGAIVLDGIATSWPLEWVFNLHENLLVGSIGQTIIGIEGLALIFLAGSGVVYWWPGRKRLRQGFRVKLDASADLRWRTLHRAGGAGISVLLLASALTGVMMVWKDPLRDGLATVVTVARRPAPKIAAQPDAPMVPVDRLIAQARARFAYAPLRQLRFPSGGRVVAVFLDSGRRSIRADGSSQVYFNAYTGADLGDYVAGELPPSSEFLDWLYTVHTGLWAGLLSRLLLLFTGIALAGMAVSGLWLWYTRTARRRRNAVRRPA